MISEKELLKLRDKYPSETKIKLLKSIDDIPAGTIGTVDFVDDAGNINMEWENGSSLSLIEEIDSFEIISRPEKIKSECPKCTPIDLMETMGKDAEEMKELEK